MIKITYGDLNNGIGGPINRMAHEGRFTPKVAYALVRLNKRLIKEMQLAQELFGRIVKEYAELDEKGEVKPGEKSSYIIPDDKKAAFAKAQDEMLSIEISIDLEKIKIDDIDRGCRLTPVEVDMLEPVLDLPAELTGEPLAATSGAPATPAAK